MQLRPRALPLLGHAVLLSASVPSESRDKKYRCIPDAFARIEEAVLRVASAVFRAGGTLVFGGHPSISPLIGYLCTQYRTPRLAEASVALKALPEKSNGGPAVVMWQSKAYSGSWFEPSERLAQMPGVEVKITEALEDERYDSSLPAEPQCHASLQAMRRAMLRTPELVAMVAIGGMEGVERECEMFFEQRGSLPVYVLESTGGAAQSLYDVYKNRIRSFDEEVQRHVREFQEEIRKQRELANKMAPGIAGRGPELQDESHIPYANVAIRIVDDIITNLGRNA